MTEEYKRDPVLIGGNYYSWEDAEAIAEDNRLAMERDRLYEETYTAFDGHTGRDYVENPALQHPYPTAFKHFRETIGLDPEEAHLLACGENRFDLINVNFDDEKRILATKFYDWLFEQDYWSNSRDWELRTMGEDEPVANTSLESPIFSFLESNWCYAPSHPLFEALTQENNDVDDDFDLDSLLGFDFENLLEDLD